MSRQFYVGIRKQLGAYYTPDWLAEAIASWSIREKTDHILEPSFGAGALVFAAFNRLKQLGNSSPENHLYGCDISEDAHQSLTDSLGDQYSIPHIIKNDFLATQHSDYSNILFDCVIANPPFTRHHSIDKSLRAKHRHLIEKHSIPRTAGLWVYFLLHACSFLRPGGRIAFILPQSFRTSRYASNVKHYIASSFSRSNVIDLQFPAFKDFGTDERCVALLCDGFSLTGPAHFSAFYTMHHKGAAISCITETLSNHKHEASAADNSLSSRTLQISPPYFSNGLVKQLGDICSIEIGIVTGLSKFFLLNQASVDKFGIPEDDLMPIISRTRHVNSLDFSMQMMEQLRHKGERVLLLYPTNVDDRNSPTRNYLAQIPRWIRKSTVWLNKRKPWYRPIVGTPPHAVLTYFGSKTPLLSAVPPGVHCTNALHKVHFKEAVPAHMRKFVSIALLSSISQLSAERLGLRFSGGALKLDPSKASQIDIPFSEHIDVKEIAPAFFEINQRLHCGDLEQARLMADTFLTNVIGSDIVSLLSTAREQLQVLRRSSSTECR
jgi:adenine-specific DNA-methyltransferase